MQESNQEPELHYRTQDTDELQTSSLKQSLVDWARVLGTGTINLAKSPRSLIPPLGTLAYAALMPLVISFMVTLPSAAWSRNHFRSYYDVRCLLHLCLPPDGWYVILAPEAWLITFVLGSLLPSLEWWEAFFLTCMPTFFIVWIRLDLVFSQRWGAWGRVSLVILATVIRIIGWSIFVLLDAFGRAMMDLPGEPYPW